MSVFDMHILVEANNLLKSNSAIEVTSYSFCMKYVLNEAQTTMLYNILIRDALSKTFTIVANNLLLE